MKIILHIGLHKTASTFLQWEVFSRFDEKDSGILYNPNVILKSLSKIVFLGKKYNDKIPEVELKKYIEENKRILNCILTDKKYSDKKYLLISWERLSQNPYLLNYLYSFNIIREIFQECGIIIFLRYQPDFFLSTYKQLIHEGRLTSIKDFLNFREGEFRSSINSGLPNININDMDYSKLLQCYINNYGRNNVHIYFYENSMKESVESIFKILQVDMPQNIKFTKPVNRGYSALAIRMTFLRARVYRLLKIKQKKQDDARSPLKIFNLGWSEARRQKSLLFLIPLFFYKVYWTLFGAARSPLGSWRGFIQKVFDRLVYFDWDLLEESGLRILLENKFKHENIKLLKFVDRECIPEKYIK